MAGSDGVALTAARQDVVVVITGASSGIGAALATRLGSAGRRLVLAARDGVKLTAVGSRAAPPDCVLTVPTDVTRRPAVELLRDAAIGRFGRIDVWVNNAGRGISRPVLELTEADVDEMMAVNLKSALYGMQAVVPYFLARGHGHLVNVSSVLARAPTASHRSAYNAAKAGLNALSSNLRMDLLRQGVKDVHVSVVMPGLVTTEFALNAVHSSGPSPRPPAHVPQPQTPEEVADVIARLIDEPRAELFTNPAAADVVQRYVADVGAFEERLTRPH